MATNSPGWAVELVGDQIDLDDFRQMLAGAFDPWVEDVRTDEGLRPLLRSKGWANLSEAADVLRDAGRIIDRLNGEALLIHSDAKPLKLGGPIKFGQDGTRQPIIFAATGHIVSSGGRSRGRMADASALSKSPKESLMQKWFREAEADDVRADLFVHLSRADNWYDLYKSMELAERLTGSVHELLRAIGSDAEMWKDVHDIANYYRHAPGKYRFPPSAIKLDHARIFVLKVVARLL